MTNAKHTPGPWAVGTETRGYEVCTLHGVERQPTEGGLGQSWVYVYPQRVINGDWHCPGEAEQLANARLITAAPDLLEALKGLLADVEDYQRINNLGGEDNHWQVIARAVIAKAEGS